MDVFEVEKLKIETETKSSEDETGGEDEEGIMLIDVGGGRGHELSRLAKEKQRLGLKGKLILQDRKEVLEQVPSEWRGLFEREVHDFFTPQEERFWGARTYYVSLIPP